MWRRALGLLVLLLLLVLPSAEAQPSAQATFVLTIVGLSGSLSDNAVTSAAVAGLQSFFPAVTVQALP